MTRIYFCGSIRGGREMASEYMEIITLLKMAKPILCLYKYGSRKKLSAMVAGSDGVKLHTYRDPEELEAVLSGFISLHVPRRTS